MSKIGWVELKLDGWTRVDKFMQGWKGGQVAIGVEGWMGGYSGKGGWVATGVVGWTGGCRGGRVAAGVDGWLSCGAYLNEDVPLFPRS